MSEYIKRLVSSHPRHALVRHYEGNWQVLRGETWEHLASGEEIPIDYYSVGKMVPPLCVLLDYKSFIWLQRDGSWEIGSPTTNSFHGGKKPRRDLRLW